MNTKINKHKNQNTNIEDGIDRDIANRSQIHTLHFPLYMIIIFTLKAIIVIAIYFKLHEHKDATELYISGLHVLETL